MQAISSNLQPSDLVGTVSWLLSDASAFVTGHNIQVDGGTRHGLILERAGCVILWEGRARALR